MLKELKKELKQELEQKVWETYLEKANASQKDRQAILELVVDSKKFYDMVENDSLSFADKLFVITNIAQKTYQYGYDNCFLEWDSYFDKFIRKYMYIIDIGKKNPHLAKPQEELKNMEKKVFYGGIQTLTTGLIKEIYNFNK